MGILMALAWLAVVVVAAIAVDVAARRPARHENVIQLSPMAERYREQNGPWTG